MIRKLIGRLLSLRLVVICLALLMVLTLWGTIHQVRYGLWDAQQTYFSSWWFPAFGILPFPGALSVLLVLFISLTLAMLYRFSLGWRQAGLVTSHLGLMLLLAGGWITHYYGEESFLTLVEGEGSNVSSSYREWELSMWDAPGPDRKVVAFDTEAMRPGATFSAESYGLSFTVDTYHGNCQAFTAGDGSADPPVLNASGIQVLKEAKRSKQPEADVPGLIVEVASGDEEPVRVLLFGGDPRPTTLRAGDREVQLSLRKKRLPLPLYIALADFKAEFHPNTQTPKSFASRIDVRIGDMEREVVVEMNHPFRYLGYTFFQASYGNLQGGSELSTFAVTRNYGRLIPYVATAVTVLGLLIHFVIEITTRARLKNVV